MTEENDLLGTLARQVEAQAFLGDPEAGPITYLQAESIAQLLMPSITAEEFLQLNRFCRLGEQGMGPCLREDIAAILRKVVDEIPVDRNELP